MNDPDSGWRDPELAALGRIVVRFADLDWCAETLLKGFMRPGSVAILMCTGENTSWKLDKLAAIATQTLADQVMTKDLDDWVRAARYLVSRRNKLMHSFYLAAPGGAQRRLKAGTRGGKWRGEAELIDLVELEEVAGLLADGVTVAWEIMGKLPASGQWIDPNGS